MMLWKVICGVAVCAERENSVSADWWIIRTGVFESVSCKMSLTECVNVVDATPQEYSSITRKNLFLFSRGNRAVKPERSSRRATWSEINVRRIRDWQWRNEGFFPMRFENVKLSPMDNPMRRRPSEIPYRDSDAWLVRSINHWGWSNGPSIKQTSALLENVSSELRSGGDGLLLSEGAKTPSDYSQEGSSRRGNESIVLIGKNKYPLNDIWSDVIAVAIGLATVIVGGAYIIFGGNK
jgi:hypothetical protein